jgi:dihydroflavonol-4-reductase
MKILVTGSTGFIGSHLCRSLLAKGYHVRAFHRPGSPTQLIEDLPVEHAIGDITDASSLQNPMRGVQVVFHAAAKLGKSTPQETYAVTVGGTRNVLQAAMISGVHRVVHTSSVAALGVPVIPGIHPESIKHPALMDERHSWNYRPEWWRYGHAKHLAEMEVQRAVAMGLDAVIVNPTLVIGAGDINKISGDVILRVDRGQLKIATQGGLNAIHISDAVNGHLTALESGKRGERYILGGNNLTHLDFLIITAEAVGAKPPGMVLPARLIRSLIPLFSLWGIYFHLPFSPEAARKVGYHFYYDSSKAQNELGVTAAHSIHDAIIQSYNWYHAQGIDKLLTT